ncbi:unnamed protein product [Urochloa humidicola]
MAGLSSWPDLPPDLIALILRRLPWLLDRLSFRSVCRAWRHLPPPPLLRSNAFDDTFQTLTGDELPPRLLFTVPPAAAASPPGTAAAAATTFLLRCYDDWLLCCNDRDATWFLFNPLAAGTAAAAAVVDVPLLRDDRPGTRMQHPAKRIIACSPELLAGILGRGDVAFYRPPPPPAAAPAWSVCPPDTRGWGWYLDIALYRGKIYALKNNNELFFYNLDGGAPEHVFSAHPPLEDPKELADWIGHLVVSRGKLLMVRWRVPYRKGIKLLVFEADLEVGRWVEVHDLDGEALFVGRGCSRAIRFTGDDERLQGNRVYFLGSDLADCCHLIENAGTPSYGFYDLRTGKISQVFLDGRPSDRPHYGMDWFFPSV